jgi:hypothetical protein
MDILVTQMPDVDKRLQDARLEQEKTRLSRQIEATDAAIDTLLYELFGRILPNGRFYSTPKAGLNFEVKDGSGWMGAKGFENASVTHLSGFYGCAG